MAPKRSRSHSIKRVAGTSSTTSPNASQSQVKGKGRATSSSSTVGLGSPTLSDTSSMLMKPPPRVERRRRGVTISDGRPMAEASRTNPFVNSHLAALYEEMEFPGLSALSAPTTPIQATGFLGSFGPEESSEFFFSPAEQPRPLSPSTLQHFQSRQEDPSSYLYPGQDALSSILAPIDTSLPAASYSTTHARLPSTEISSLGIDAFQMQSTAPPPLRRHYTTEYISESRRPSLVRLQKATFFNTVRERRLSRAEAWNPTPSLSVDGFGQVVPEQSYYGEPAYSKTLIRQAQLESGDARTWNSWVGSPIETTSSAECAIGQNPLLGVTPWNGNPSQHLHHSPTPPDLNQSYTSSGSNSHQSYSPHQYSNQASRSHSDGPLSPKSHSPASRNNSHTSPTDSVNLENQFETYPQRERRAAAGDLHLNLPPNPSTSLFGQHHSPSSTSAPLENKGAWAAYRSPPLLTASSQPENVDEYSWSPTINTGTLSQNTSHQVHTQQLQPQSYYGTQTSTSGFREPHLNQDPFDPQYQHLSHDQGAQQHDRWAEFLNTADSQGDNQTSDQMSSLNMH